MPINLSDSLENILEQYRKSFSSKVYNAREEETDLLMEIFGITTELKRENAQYWGRELGMCWQRLVVALFKQTHSDFGLPLRFGADEPCDLVVGNHAIDTKYRIGSGDSGTLKKFKSNAKLLQSSGYTPILLIVRDDSLDSAINACLSGGWTIFTGDKTYDYIQQSTNFDIKEYLFTKALEYKIERQK